MGKKKVYYEETERSVDSESGEIRTETNRKTSLVEREPDYVKLYLSDIVRLKDLPPSAERILMIIVKHMGYGNFFQAYMPLKKLMAEQLNMSINTINSMIYKLKKSGILIPMEKYGRGLYLVDPNLFGRGKWNEIKDLRLVIEYKEDGSKRLSSNAPEKLKELKLIE